MISDSVQKNVTIVIVLLFIILLPYLCSQVYENNSASTLLNLAEKLFNESLWLEDSKKLKLHQKNYGNHGDDKSSFINENQDYEVKENSSAKSNIASEKYKSHFILNKNENGNKNGDSEEKCVGFEEENEKLYPKDYSSATYYLASNMTIQDNEKQALLEAENIIVRLR